MPGTHTQSDYLLSLLTEKEAAQLLGLSIRTLQAWRYRKEGPPFIKMSGRAIRYQRSDLIAWADHLRVVEAPHAKK
ncbi:MAG TPA: DNA-binding protein [Rhodospirillaceae bacterium]|nr:MAG: hypothetical protein A2018_00620 [Alphaproteobacteria bacterium GWF2_58_20]HAU28676.1 DNA-binding protein [Rhodospirillaceae bacterium]